MTLFPFPPGSLRNRRKWGSVTRGQSSGTGDTPSPGASRSPHAHQGQCRPRGPARELSFLINPINTLTTSLFTLRSLHIPTQLGEISESTRVPRPSFPSGDRANLQASVTAGTRTGQQTGAFPPHRPLLYRHPLCPSPGH